MSRCETHPHGTIRYLRYYPAGVLSPTGSDATLRIPLSLRDLWSLWYESLASMAFWNRDTEAGVAGLASQFDFRLDLCVGEKSLTVSVLPRVRIRTFIKEMQQWRPYLPTRVQFVSPDAPRLISLQRVQQ